MQEALLSNSTHLATLIERDLRERGLRPGDRYLTAREAGERLDVSAMTANRALRRLADRGILVRARRAGTFVGDRFDPANDAAVRCIHVIAPRTYFNEDKEFLDKLVTGLTSELTHEAIQFTFVTRENDVAVVQMLAENSGGQVFAGAVLFISSPQLQRWFAEKKIPAVVSGSVYPEVGELAWVDRDQRRIGELLGRHAVRRGHRAVAYLTRDVWGYGDNLTLDGIQASLGAARLSHDALTIRSVAHQEALLTATARELLSRPNRPTALICRSLTAAEVVRRTARSLKLRVPRDLLILVADPGLSRQPRFPCTTATLGATARGALIGRMLKCQMEHKPLSPNHAVIGVELKGLGRNGASRRKVPGKKNSR